MRLNFNISKLVYYLRVATSPAGINFPVFTNLEPITPDNTNDVTAKIKDGSFCVICDCNDKLSLLNRFIRFSSICCD